MRRTFSIPAASAVAIALAAGAAGGASGSSHATAIPKGYYAANSSVAPSADVEFHVHSGNAVPDLGLACQPTDASLASGSGFAGVLLRAPKLHVSKSGTLSYSGPTRAHENPGGINVVAGTMTLKLHHVSGPTKHFTYQGRHLTTTVAWKGTVSSPVCGDLPHGGSVTLVGKTTED